MLHADYLPSPFSSVGRRTQVERALAANKARRMLPPVTGEVALLAAMVSA